jgi:hypothetical protein
MQYQTMADRTGNDVATENHPEEKAKDFQYPQNGIGISEKVLVVDAAIGFAVEKELGPWEAVKAYPNAILWALVMAACVIMEGYDTALLGSFFACRQLLRSNDSFKLTRSKRRFRSNLGNLLELLLLRPAGSN